jgi:hypothetical protein
MNSADRGAWTSGSDGNGGAVLAWLLQGDPSIRWQVLADLVGAAQGETDTERALLAVQGWGARLLAAQSDDGRWADGLYSPKWTSTTYTLLLLHRLGLPRGDPQAVAGCRQVWEGARFYDGGLTLAKSIRQPEAYVTAMLILLASSFGLPVDRLDPAVNGSVTNSWPMEAGTASRSEGDRDTARSTPLSRSLTHCSSTRGRAVTSGYQTAWTAVARSSWITSSTVRTALVRW